MTADTRQDWYDVVVVGGGAAGLSGAIVLGRSRRSVLVVDAGTPRNATAGHVHNYLGREGTPPGDLLASGRAEAAGYGVQFITGSVAEVRRLEPGELPDAGTALPRPADAPDPTAPDPTAPDSTGADVAGFDSTATRPFAVRLDGGRTVHARRLLVATGLTDELPPVPGLAERWGRDVLHCPYCHGWEVRGRAIAVLALGPTAVHQAQMFRQLSDDVTLLLNDRPEPDDEQLEQLAARGIRVVRGEVAALEVRDDEVHGVRMGSGEVVPCQAVVVAPRFPARADVLAPLVLTPAEFTMDGQVLGTFVPSEPTGATAVQGVWVAGNVTNPMATVIAAAAAGLDAGAMINADLIAEETREAVAAYRRHVAHAHRGHAAGADTDADAVDNAGFWEEYYREEHLGSGRANPVLVEVAGLLKPGRALDLGSGEGSDAIWLAAQGWQVTAADISRTVLDRAATRAGAAGVGDRIDWQRHDLTQTLPEGSYDLVSAHYVHSPVEMDRAALLRGAAGRVAPGGTLLVVGHAAMPPWSTAHADDVHLPTTDDVLADLNPAVEGWHRERVETRDRPATGPGGRTGTLTDSIVVLVRPDGGDD